ncbi:MAG TPA: hypothetical protein P5114_07555 [Hyphomicrobiaceae bacterium]|nr:hypothetical protein [Hyphomicrobiaceae bacterium]
MFRRLFYLVLLSALLAVGAMSAYFFNQHYLVWLACKDASGLCFTEGATLVERAAPMGIPLAYAAITLVMGLLSLRALWGVLRPSRRNHA